MTIRTVMLALGGAVLLMATSVGARGQATDAYGFTVEQVADRVSALYQRGFHVQPRGDVTVIEQSRGVVLIDSGGSPAGADEVIALVRARTKKPVTAVVLTHWHGDHVLGVSRLLQEWPRARVIATAPTRDMLASPATDRYMPGDDAEANARLQRNLAGAVAYLAEQGRQTDAPEAVRAGYATAAQEMARYAREMAPAHRVAPTETFAGKLLLPDPAAPVEVSFLGPANTAGDAVAWLPKQRVLVTGDTVIMTLPYGFNTYPAGWIAVLRQLRSHDFRVLVPGHGAPMRDGAYIDRMISLIEETRAKVASLAGDATTTPANVASRTDLSAQRAAFVGADTWLGQWFDTYWTGPATVSALHEVRGEPVVQGAP